MANRIDSGEDVETVVLGICNELKKRMVIRDDYSNLYEALSELSLNFSIPGSFGQNLASILDNAMLETVLRSTMKSSHFPEIDGPISKYNGTLWFLFLGENPTAFLYIDNDPMFRNGTFTIYSYPSPTTMCRSIQREVATTAPLGIQALKVFEQFLRERYGESWRQHISWWIGLPSDEPGTKSYDNWTRELYMRLFSEHQDSQLRDAGKREFVFSITGKYPKYLEKTKRVSLTNPNPFLPTYGIDWYIRQSISNKLDPLIYGTNVMVERSEEFVLSVIAARFWTNFAKAQGMFLPPHPLQYLFEGEPSF